MLHQFLGFARARHFVNADLVDTDAFRRNRGRDSVADPALDVMVFDGDDGVVGALGVDGPTPNESLNRICARRPKRRAGPWRRCRHFPR